MNDEKPLTTTQVARMLKLDPSTIRRWSTKYRMPVARSPSQHRRFPRAALRTWLHENYGADAVKIVDLLDQQHPKRKQPRAS